MSAALDSPEQRWRSWRGWAARLVVLAAVLLRFSPLLSLDGTFPGHDWLEIHQADAEQVQLAQHEGSLVPLWTPYVLGGSPLYAVATKPLSYPPFLLAVPLFGAPGAMNVLGLLHVLIAAAGMLALMRRLDCGPAASAAAAILLVGGTWPGSMFRSQPFWAYALAWWPWALRAAVDVLDADEPRAVLAGGVKLGLFLALQALAGGVFQVHWLFCFTAAFALPFLLRRARSVATWRRGLALAVAGALCLGLAAARVVPALEWMKTSGRSQPLTHDEIFYGYDEMLKPDTPHPSLTVLSATLLEGDRLGVRAMAAGCVLGLLLAPRRRVALAALLGLLFCLLIASGAAHELLLHVLPGYDRMRMPYRYLAPAGLGAALLAALGVEGLLRRLPRAAGGAALAAGGALLLADVGLLPGVNFQRLTPAPMSERQAAAGPVLANFDDGSRRRFHSPVVKEQPLWIARGLRSTVGSLGGGGSESPAFTAWLPPKSSALELEALHRGVLDVLATRWTLSFERLDVPWLRLIYEPRAVSEPTDGWAARVAPDGSGLQWSGYVGGDGVEEGYGVAAAPDGRAWVVGSSTTADGSFGTGAGGETDAFAALLGVDGSGPETVRLLGGAGADAARDVAVAPDGRAFVTGSTTAGRGGDRLAPHSNDAFVARLPDGAPLDTEPPAFVGPLPGPMPFVLQGADALVAVNGDGLLVLRPLAPDEDQSDVVAVRLRLLDGSAAPTGRAPRAGHLNQIVGPPASWHTALPLWSALAFDGARAGLDLSLSSEPEGLTLRAAGLAGAEPALRLQIEGGRASVDVAGRLVIETGAAPLVLARPTARGSRDAGERELPAAWALQTGDDGRVIARVDLAGLPGTAAVATRLLLDGGRLGGAFGDYGKAIALGPDGDVYVAGTTFSFGTLPAGPWPEPGAPATLRRSDADAFVARLDGRSGELRWWTLLGGAGGDYAQGLTVDAQGRAYLIGSTRSAESSFPVKGGPGLHFGGVEDAFVARLSPDGAAVEWCGYVGGAAGDYGQGIALDAQGRAWITGDTKSDEASLPVVVGPDLSFNGGADAFVGCIAADGSHLDVLGYIGGRGVDVAYDIALGPGGEIWLCGVTESKEDSFPVAVGPDLTANGAWDGFVARVRPDGTGLLSCGFIGGAGTDNARGLCVDARGVLLAGTTRSAEDSFPVRGGPGARLGRDPYDAYVARAHRRVGDEPYKRPLVYERAGALPHVALVERPLLVTGAAEARAAAIRQALDRRSFDARAVVYLEDEACDPAALDGAALAGLTGVLFAGEDAAAPAPRALLARAGGRLTPQKDAGVLWEPDAPRGPGLQPLDESRVDARCNSLALQLPEAAPPLLLLSETFALHPGWTARIDGRPAPLLHADGCITALRLPPGARRVEFRYWPPGLSAGLAVSALTLAALLLVVLRRRRA